MTETIKNEPACLHCQQSSQQVPLITLQYDGKSYWICPTHLPVLIHKPHLVQELFPGLGEADKPH